MKNTIAILAVSVAGAYTGFSQGEINFINTSHTRISVNAATGGAAVGQSSISSTYYYALFSSASATTVVGNGALAEIPLSNTVGQTGSYAFSDSNWTFDGTANMGISSTSTAGAVGPITTDANGYTQIPGEPASSYFVVLGWSANIGSTISSLETFLAGGDNGLTGFVGESAVSGLVTTGNGSPGSTSTPPTLFGTVSPAIPAFTLGEVTPAPEPTTIALGAMGAASLLAFRRKKA